MKKYTLLIAFIIFMIVTSIMMDIFHFKGPYFLLEISLFAGFFLIYFIYNKIKKTKKWSPQSTQKPSKLLVSLAVTTPTP